jgi:hypothetical protein
MKKQLVIFFSLLVCLVAIEPLRGPVLVIAFGVFDLTLGGIRRYIIKDRRGILDHELLQERNTTLAILLAIFLLRA